MQNKLLLLMGGGGSEIEDVELVANDNELVFQPYKTATDINLFAGASQITHPTGAFLVYVNGELTSQSYNSLAFNAGDVVKIVAMGVNSFPVFKATNNNACVRDIAKLPRMGGVYDVTMLDSTFYYNKLVRAREGLFANNTEVIQTDSMFSNTLIDSIPEDIYAYFPNLTSVRNDFDWCERVTEIPENLFANNPRLTSVTSPFDHAGISEIPANLFANNPNLEVADGIFEYNRNLKTVSGDFFANNPKLKNVSYCFNQCGITEIPENLFANNPLLQQANFCFWVAYITEIPSGLFANNPELYYLYSCFSSCKSLTSIPSSLFANNPKLQNVSNCFSGCESLTSIPSGLFANNPSLQKVSDNKCGVHPEDQKVSRYNGLFHYCRALTNVPEDLFSNNPLINDFSGSFSLCTSLTSVPENLFVNNTRATKFNETFYGCPKLSGRIKIASINVSEASDFCTGAGAITVVVPAGSTTETTFRAVAQTLTNLTVETY